MAGRAATAVKSKSKPKSQSKVKAVEASKTAAPKSVKSIDTVAEVETTTATVAVAPKPRRRVKAEIRTRIYWAVFNQDLKRVAVFEFDQKNEAEKRASKLMESSGEHHFIQKIKATVQA